jgi:transposase
MQRLQAFKYELMAKGEQQRQMRRFAGSCRFFFNKALALQKERYDCGKKLGYARLCKELTAWRNGAETPWHADAPVHLLQQALKDLERAYANFFAKRADFPRFKKRGQSDSLRYPDPKQIKLDQANSRLFLPRLGWLRYRNSRDVPGVVRNVNRDQPKRTCPACGHVSADNRQAQAQFLCVRCGFKESADVVGAINVLRAGHARFAGEVSGAVMPPAAGTHRSDSEAAQCRA